MARFSVSKDATEIDITKRKVSFIPGAPMNIKTIYVDNAATGDRCDITFHGDDEYSIGTWLLEKEVVGKLVDALQKWLVSAEPVATRQEKGV